MTFSELSKLVRLSNLTIVFATQMLIWFCLIRPLPQLTEGTLFLDWPNALLLSLSTVLIAAGGYIINDYFDVKIDAINRPEKSLIGKDINPKFAILLHNFCNVAGLIIAAILAYQLKSIVAFSIPFISTILLWFYSTHFKRQYISGNVVVALLTAMSIGIFIPYEPLSQQYLSHPFLYNSNQETVVNPVWILFVYCFFAFSLTWIREIIKDLEDFKGDAEDGCVTMPIKIGLRKTIRFIKLLTIVSVILLALAAGYLMSHHWRILGIYIIVALIIPIGYLFIKIGQSMTQTHFARYSKYLKVLMLLGISTLILFYFLQFYCS
ncbi:hypothetical protein DBR32_01410 [Taibaiella sp. KBW10]|uniref:geranylgeranylglycerol-phosphate geranylgeranyltransferase n=1 Tax=Taibaiella sp. KBW10 TaxID=2153357 RepID=UPI000F597627|nr:geranylgeranylglycerol-phosphate geranylgeranyltransferase [Taibaiella sp. KBW10]RQO32295.1 hypothetical protein DBR32_01410 [Taibaiella sp. KBW10]